MGFFRAGLDSYRADGWAREIVISLSPDGVFMARGHRRVFSAEVTRGTGFLRSPSFRATDCFVRVICAGQGSSFVGENVG